MRSLNIFGRKIKVRMANLDHLGLDGYYDPEKYEIVIGDNCDDLNSSIIHECLHAIWDRLGLNQTDIPLNVQELIVEGFANALVENEKEIESIKKALKKRHKPGKK